MPVSQCLGVTGRSLGTDGELGDDERIELPVRAPVSEILGFSHLRVQRQRMSAVPAGLW